VHSGFKAKLWLTKDILSMIKQKKSMYKKIRRNAIESDLKQYKQFCNKFTKMKTSAKKNYYSSEL